MYTTPPRLLYEPPGASRSLCSLERVKNNLEVSRSGAAPSMHASYIRTPSSSLASDQSFIEIVSSASLIVASSVLPLKCLQSNSTSDTRIGVRKLLKSLASILGTSSGEYVCAIGKLFVL